ncbi:MAG TPA: peptidoglycan-binding domain-containing protein, partial [Bryobacteraceae bacterium]|nr:peptidoglycan-binding domain-containing protein [Bryobacteraceae bacterium]
MNRRYLIAVCALLTLVELAEGAGRKRRNTRSRTVEPPFTAEAVNQPTFTGSEGFAILRAQILLDRAHFSPGEIDGKPGANFERALRGFQTTRKLEASGALDQPTWAALNADTSPVVVPYRITDVDAAGPFAPLPGDMMELAKMDRPGYASLEEALGEMFHASPGLLARMNPGVSMKAGQEILVPNVLTAPSGKAARMVVTRAGVLTVYDTSGAVVAQYPCSS